MLPQAAPPTTEYNTPTVNQQGTALLGNAPIQNQPTPQIDPSMFNSTAFAANPGAANMIQALKGGL